MPQFGTYWSGLADGSLDDASSIGITDSGAYFTATDVEAALQEVAAAQERISITAGSFHSVVGSPSLSATASFRHAAWLMDASADEAIAARFSVPSSWSSFDIDVLWTNHSSGTGDVVFNLNFVKSVAGASINAPGSFSGPVTVTAGGQDILKVSTVLAGTASVSGALNGLRLYRLGTNVADTLANDIAILGVDLVRAS